MAETITIIYMRHGVQGESVRDVTGIPADRALQLAYETMANMIEEETAAPQSATQDGVTYTLDDLEARFGPWWRQGRRSP